MVFLPNDNANIHTQFLSTCSSAPYSGLHPGYVVTNRLMQPALQFSVPQGGETLLHSYNITINNVTNSFRPI